MSRGRNSDEADKTSQSSSHNRNDCKYVHSSGARFKIFPIRGDGNCLFRSMAYFVLGKPNSHSFIRNQIVDYVCSHWDRFQNFLPQDDGAESYRNRMGVTGTHGSQAEIVAFAELFGCNMVVYSEDHPEREPVVIGDSTTDCFVLYSGQPDYGHYDVLVPSPDCPFDVLAHRHAIRDLRRRIEQVFSIELREFYENFKQQ